MLIGFLALYSCDKEPKYDFTGSYSGTTIRTEVVPEPSGDSTITSEVDETKEVLREGDYLYVKELEKSLISISTADHPVINFAYGGYSETAGNPLSIRITMNGTDLIIDVEEGYYPYITNQHFEGVKVE